MARVPEAKTISVRWIGPNHGGAIKGHSAEIKNSDDLTKLLETLNHPQDVDEVRNLEVFVNGTVLLPHQALLVLVSLLEKNKQTLPELSKEELSILVKNGDIFRVLAETGKSGIVTLEKARKIMRFLIQNKEVDSQGVFSEKKAGLEGLRPYASLELVHVFEKLMDGGLVYVSEVLMEYGYDLAELERAESIKDEIDLRLKRREATQKGWETRRDNEAQQSIDEDRENAEVNPTALTAAEWLRRIRSYTSWNVNLKKIGIESSTIYSISEKQSDKLFVALKENQETFISMKSQKVVVEQSIEWFFQYLMEGKDVVARKIFDNALLYYDSKVEFKGDSEGRFQFSVHGKSSSEDPRGVEYTSVMGNNEWSCSCQLYRGEDQFKGQGGMCSHILATKLWIIS